MNYKINNIIRSNFYNYNKIQKHFRHKMIKLNKYLMIKLNK